MGMNKINGAPLYPSSLADKLQNKTRGSEEKGSVNGSVPEDGVPSQRNSEKAEISEAAHNLMDLRQAVDSGRIALAAVPDVREDKVEQVRTRLAQGYYNSVEVRDVVADKLNKVIEGLDKF